MSAQIPKQQRRPFTDGPFHVTALSNETLEGLFATFSTAKNAFRQLTPAETGLYDQLVRELSFRFEEEAKGRPEDVKTPGPTAAEVLPGGPADAVNLPPIKAGWLQLMAGTHGKEGDEIFVVGEGWKRFGVGREVLRGQIVIRPVTMSAALDDGPALPIPDGWELLPKAEQVRPYHKIKNGNRWDWVNPATVTLPIDAVIIREKTGGAR